MNDVSPNAAKRIWHLKEAANAHPGRVTQGLLWEINQPFLLFLWPNARELDHLLSLFPCNKQGQFLFDIRLQRELDVYIEEVHRLVHNLVAAVGTTIEHTRRTLRKAYPEDDTHPVWHARNEQLKAFDADPELEFIRDLRDMVLHRSRPLIRARMEWGPNSAEDFSIRLMPEPLLEWEGWKRDTRSWIASCTEGIPFQRVVNRYVKEAANLQRAISLAIEQLDPEGLAAFRRVAAEHDQLVTQSLKESFGSPPPQTPGP
jgi:hypothetical protein